MHAFSNSVFCTADLGLIKFYLGQASENSSSKCLKDLGRAESQKLVREFILPAVQQTVTDSSNVGNWKDEKDFVLLKIHGWFFLSWMTTTLGNTAEMFRPIGTEFYLQVLKMCSFEKFLLQCLSNVVEEATEVLIQAIVRTSKDGEDDVLLLQLIEQSLSQLGNPEEKKILANKLCHILTKIASNVEQSLQVNILAQLSERLNKLLVKFKIASSWSLTNVFTKRLNIIEFNERIDELMIDTGVSKSTMKNLAPKLVNESDNSLVQAILCLVSCVKHVINVEWRLLFTWQSTDHRNELITNCRGVLFDIFKSCKSLQALAVISSCNELQDLVGVLQPYFQHIMSFEEKTCIEDIVNSQVRKSNDVDEIGMIKGTVEEKMQHALFQIDENLVDDEGYFEWLLLTEELYVDERWLKCVVTHAKTFVSIKIVKMLLDVLSVLQEFDILQDGAHSNIYSSLKKVILELLPCLSLTEQREVVLYNFDLICLHFDSYQHHSFFLLPGEDESSFIKDFLTATMNKLVNRSGQVSTNDIMNDDVMNHDVMSGVIQGCLVAPYLTLKELITEASKHNGYEKVVCELFQRAPWLVSLGHKDDDGLIIQILRDVMSSLTSKKHEDQYLKLIEALMQPYMMQPDYETKTLVPANEISKDLAIPLLTSEDDDVICPTLVLNILAKCFSCSLILAEEQPHWMINQQPLQLLFVLLEMYQDCEQFWADWVTVSRLDDSMDRNDVALDEAWNEMNVSLKIVEEYLVPLLVQDIKREPGRYHDCITCMQDHLDLQDSITSMLIVPLLQNDVFNECKIKLPNPIITLMSSHFNVEPIKDKESAHSFWTIYFKSCALSNEVFGIYWSKLKESHPHETEAVPDDSEGIIHALATILPFSSWTQWQRMINITLEMVKYRYLILPEEWKDDLPELPKISNLGVNTSDVLVSILLDISSRDWATSYVWNITLKKYVSTIKEITLAIGKEDKFEVTCHLLAHLAYIACKIVPRSFQENISIVLLDIFNQCLASAGNSHYLQGIIDMVSWNELRLTLNARMDKIL